MMSSDDTLYDFLDNDKLERFFDELIEEKLFEWKLKNL
jgi:hypothetical protein